MCFLQVPEEFCFQAWEQELQKQLQCNGFSIAFSQTAILSFSTTAASQSVFFSHLKLGFFEQFVFHAFWVFVLSTRKVFLVFML